MSSQTVKEFFEQHRLESRIRSFTASSATVALAAEAIGCAPERIAKSLSFLVDGVPVLIVTSGDARVDNAKYKAQFGAKASMLHAEDTERLIGHAVGGVCPFVLKEGVRVFLDISLRRFNTVFPACGDSHTVIELTLPELETLSLPESWVDVCKGWSSPA